MLHHQHNLAMNLVLSAIDLKCEGNLQVVLRHFSGSYSTLLPCSLHSRQQGSVARKGSLGQDATMPFYSFNPLGMLVAGSWSNLKAALT